jgi:glycerate-2-kinase
MSEEVGRHILAAVKGLNVVEMNAVRKHLSAIKGRAAK